MLPAQLVSRAVIPHLLSASPAGRGRGDSRANQALSPPARAVRQPSAPDRVTYYVAAPFRARGSLARSRSLIWRTALIWRTGMPDRPAEPGSARPAAPRGLPPGAAGAVDDLAATYQRGEGQPGIAYGIVAGGSLAHEGGVGQRWLGGPPPDAGTVFRLASMTKSFTASALLALRDAGLVRLDDPVTDFVPELRGQAGVTPDSPAISLRHLLTMTAGFPTDDPWGDRQQGTPLPDFAALLARGVRPAWAPGTCFEYSNLGYALLGRVISAVAQAEYPDFVRARVLEPLEMARTGFVAGEFDPAGLARGYARGADGWTELTPDPVGAFAPMGGVFSCVRDLARWVDGFVAAFPPGGPRGGGAHPLPPATRREMQQPAVTLPRAQPRDRKSTRL